MPSLKNDFLDEVERKQEYNAKHGLGRGDGIINWNAIEGLHLRGSSYTGAVKNTHDLLKQVINGNRVHPLPATLKYLKKQSCGTKDRRQKDIDRNKKGTAIAQSHQHALNLWKTMCNYFTNHS